MPWHEENQILGTAERLALLRGAGALFDLSGWEPVGSMLEDVRMALHGSGGMTRGEFRRVLQWADRWQSIDPRLRALYGTQKDSTASCPSIAVEAALWAIMGGHGPISGPCYAVLRERWSDQYGYPPPIEMAPMPEESK